MTTIGLVRHGITEWNKLGKAQGISDIPLNEQGIHQSNLLANRLINEEKWDVLITSDLTRAIQTATIIGSKINMPISHTDRRIREIDCGKMEGTTEEERIRSWGEHWRQLDIGMEEFSNVAKRGIEFLEEVNRLYNGKRVLVVSHGALIGLTLKNLLPSKFIDTYMDNVSLTILRNKENTWECSLYNCTKHLEE